MVDFSPIEKTFGLKDLVSQIETTSGQREMVCIQIQIVTDFVADCG
jgi:hypothetical protein